MRSVSSDISIAASRSSAKHQTYGQFVPTLDRMDYIAAVSNCLGYCETIEKLLGITAPPRAQYIRVIMTELNRITSHLLWLGTHALDIGAMTVFLYASASAKKF